MMALKNGDDSQFEIIYEETHRLVYYIICSILKNKEDSEDVMQQVYMTIYKKIDQYTNSPKAWISMIARNLAINQYNKNKKEKINYLDDVELNRLSIPDNVSPGRMLNIKRAIAIDQTLKLEDKLKLDLKDLVKIINNKANEEIKKFEKDYKNYISEL